MQILGVFHYADDFELIDAFRPIHAEMLAERRAVRKEPPRQCFTYYRHRPDLVRVLRAEHATLQKRDSQSGEIVLADDVVPDYPFFSVRYLEIAGEDRGRPKSLVEDNH